jgi:hypothetical protein
MIAAMATSDIRLLEILPSSSGDALAHENPLFAADGRFALERGGPITRVFLEALPPEWKLAELVVDSTLLWLSRGMIPNGWRWFHREPYPGRAGGAWDTANGELDVEHVACAFGPSTAEVLAGEIDLAALPAPEGPEPDLRARHAVLAAWRAEGRLATRNVPEATPYRYGATTFQRYLPAAGSGFHLWLRATRGSRRPVVNGLRNVSNL